eukprot:symbB.v1.2.034101.t1/scaffold4305.1/size41623/4
MVSSRDLLERLFVTSNVGHGLNQEETGICSIFPRFVEIFAAVVLLVGGTFELFKSGQEKAPGDTGFDPLGLKGFRPPVVSTFLPENRPWMAEAWFLAAGVSHGK